MGKYDSIEIIEPTFNQLNDYAKINPYGSIFHTGHMVKVFEETSDSDIIKLAAVDTKTNKVLSSFIMPLQKIPNFPKKLYIGVSRVSNPLFFLNDEKSIIAGEKLLERYEKITKKRVVYSNIRMSFERSLPFKDIWAYKSYTYDDFINFIIDLTKGEEAVWSDLSKTPRRRIRQAESKFGLTPSFSNDEKDVKLFYEMMKSTYIRSNIYLPPISHFKAIFKHLCKDNLGKLLLIDYNGKKVAGRIILLYKNYLYDWYAGSLYDYANVPANYFAVWYVLKWGIENKYDYFDFGGGGDPKKYLGHREFKKAFGGKCVEYGLYARIQKPYYYKLLEIGKSLLGYGVKKVKKSK